LFSVSKKLFVEKRRYAEQREASNTILFFGIDPLIANGGLKLLGEIIWHYNFLP
jgi:hypothetical protein